MTEKKVIESWIQWVALTTTILAVCAALSTLKGGSNSTKTQLMTTQEANKWSHFQSKSIKQNLYEAQKDMLEVMKIQANTPKAQALIEKNLAAYEANIKRYDKEKNEIKADAEKLIRLEQDYKKHGSNFQMAIMFLQIAILLSSIGALIKKKYMWYLGLIVGSAGIIFMTNGFWLWF